MNDASASIAHFDSLLRILKYLESHKISLYEHQYHPQTFGSFVLVLGHAHERVQFSWDGREFILWISFGTFPTKNASASWTHDAYQPSQWTWAVRRDRVKCRADACNPT